MGVFKNNTRQHMHLRRHPEGAGQGENEVLGSIFQAVSMKK